MVAMAKEKSGWRDVTSLQADKSSSRDCDGSFQQTGQGKLYRKLAGDKNDSRKRLKMLRLRLLSRSDDGKDIAFRHVTFAEIKAIIHAEGSKVFPGGWEVDRPPYFQPAFSAEPFRRHIKRVAAEENSSKTGRSISYRTCSYYTTQNVKQGLCQLLRMLQPSHRKMVRDRTPNRISSGMRSGFVFVLHHPETTFLPLTN